MVLGSQTRTSVKCPAQLRSCGLTFGINLGNTLQTTRQELSQKYDSRDRRMNVDFSRIGLAAESNYFSANTGVKDERPGSPFSRPSALNCPRPSWCFPAFVANISKMIHESLKEIVNNLRFCNELLSSYACLRALSRDGPKALEKPKCSRLAPERR